MRIIIIGAGQVGLNLASRLAQEKKEVVIIDRDEKSLEWAAGRLDIQILAGSGSSPEILEKAGIREAGLLLAVTDSDEINLVACTFANMMSPKTTKLARIRNDEYLKFQEIWTGDLGISMVINPEIEVVQTIYRIMRAPGAVEVNDFSRGMTKLMGIMVDKESILCDVELSDVKERLDFEEFIVAAIVRKEKLIIPSGNDYFREGDLAYILCRDSDLEKLAVKIGVKYSPIKDVMIIGGGNIGFRLAEFLEQKSFNIKLMEKDGKICKVLSEKLDKTIVLNGDGTDQDMLNEENIAEMDLVVPLTNDDETNILSSLLAKKLGAKSSITRINKPEYAPLVRTIGLKHIVSPRLSAVNTILNRVRKGSIISAIAIREDVDVMEAVINGEEDIVNKEIKNLKLPKDALILAVLRGSEVILPSGDTIIKSGDRVTILSSRQSIGCLEKALTAKLEYY